MITFGSLFAGIGGFDLGLERAGMKCVWQVESDPYAIRVLEKHWPAVRRCKDVRDFPPTPTGWECDLICGGFPCQDISDAGKKAGIGGERSGLWSEFARIIRVLRPRFVVVENVAALLVRGIDRVLGDLATSGYDAEWETLSACDFGAPHARNRLFIIAYPYGNCVRTSRPPKSHKASSTKMLIGGTCKAGRMGNWWSNQPEPCSVVYGVPGVVDEIRGYGNAVVPQVAEWIGKRIIEVAKDIP